MATAPKPLFDPQAEALRRIQTIPALVKYLDEELGWPVDVDDWEDAVYDWQPEELNLKAEHQVAINSIKQLRPLVTGQPWGIFFVDFDKGQLPITVLRRILNGLVIKSRVQSGGHQTWLARDLLFVSSFGEGSTAHPREIALAHFTDESDVGDIPTLRVLGWDETDTGRELGYVAKTLKEKLRWPARTASQADQDAWRTQWASAFTLKYRQVINDSKSLALALAELAKRIRSRVNAVLALENDKGHLRQLHKAFKENLIADLSADGFADMFAQTITYGLFTARASRSSGALVADNLSDMVPSTNPFLKELLADFLSAGGRNRKKAKRVDFDELGINEVVATLRDVPMDAVLRAFNKEKPGDDPVIHFYEDFLKAYDKAMRAKRGVFYTPSPVVQFIVRSVDEILKTEFGIEDGLASTITWGEMLAAKPELKLPKFCTAQTPFVQVLDPATGTGTFIVEVISQVHAHMLAKWRKQGKVTKTQWQPLWVDYVQTHLLPRLYAFELMMAPYAIAHMKIGLKLAETGYTFPEDGPRVNVFLTNALEPAHEINPGLAFEAPMLAHEASAANWVKERLAPTVVIGNPPYSKAISQPAWLLKSMKAWKRGLNLAKSDLLREEWKFLRLAQMKTAASGIVGLVINRDFLDGLAKSVMRADLAISHQYVRIVDLNGDVKGRLADENVFEIEQGVTIAVLATKNSEQSNIRYFSSEGERASKLEWLLANTTSSKQLISIRPLPPHHTWTAVYRSATSPFLNWWPLPIVFPINSSGVQTKADPIVVDFDAKILMARLRNLGKMSHIAVKSEYGLDPEGNWNVEAAQKDLIDSGCNVSNITGYTYRPFDTRFTYWTGCTNGIHARPRREVMQHIVRQENLCLLFNRQVVQEEVTHFFSSRLPSNHGTFYLGNKGQDYSAPVWLYSTVKAPRRPNYSKAFIMTLIESLKLDVTDYRPEDPAAPLHAEKIFQYLYAVLHSPAYRQRYAAFLRTDFPRIPIPGSRAVFDALAQLGAQLVQWHLLEHPAAQAIGGSPSLLPAGKGTHPRWFGTDFSLQKVGEKSKSLADLSGADDQVGKVFINATSGFAHVRQSVWQHTIGGYQVLHKWLDDRRKAGRSLSHDDITHWLRVYAALDATQTLMQQVDEAVEAHGGWPGAFSQNHPPPDAATLAAEQAAQKEQLKAQKKAASTAKKMASSPSPTGETSLFDFDDVLH